MTLKTCVLLAACLIGLPGPHVSTAWMQGAEILLTVSSVMDTHQQPVKAARTLAGSQGPSSKMLEQPMLKTNLLVELLHSAGLRIGSLRLRRGIT